VALKATLEQERSPLLSNLMHFLVQVLEMHESAVEDALASNRRLARELRFDLDRFKASQQQQQQHQQQQQLPQMRAGTDDGGFDDDDNDNDDRVVATQTQAPPPVVAPTPHRPAAAAQLSTPFRTPSRSRVAATSAAVPLSAAKVKATAVAAAAAPPSSDDAPVVMRPKTPWSSLRVKSVAQTELQSVSTALSFDDAPPTAGNDDGDSNDDAFRVASTPKPRAIDKENAARNRKRVQK
jgi:hypothetical protein